MPDCAPLAVPPTIQRDWALFLDVDGTLLELASRPDDVVVPPGLMSILNELNRALSGAMALVSGRTLGQLQSLFPDCHCHLVGQHGIECDQWSTPPLPANFDRLLASAQTISVQFPGVVIEDKGSAIALHWRCNSGAEPALVALAREHAASLEGHMVQFGKMVVEVRPCGEKADAVSWFMKTDAFRGRRPVFVGDDLTDESGFEAACSGGGFGVLVGDRIGTAARRRLPDVRAVRGWLETGASHWGESQ